MPRDYPILLTDTHNSAPWLDCFRGALLPACKEFEKWVGLANHASP